MPNQPTAKIDNNDKPTLLAYNEITSAPEALRCDPIFDAIEIYNVGSGSGIYTAINRAFIDGNDNPTLLGWNETTGQIEALRSDEFGNLLVTFV